MSTSKRGKRFSPEVKSMVVKEYLNGTSASVLKDKYDVSEPSIYNWVKKFKEENKLATEQKTNATKTEVKKEVTQKKETPKKETVKRTKEPVENPQSLFENANLNYFDVNGYVPSNDSAICITHMSAVIARLSLENERLRNIIKCLQKNQSKVDEEEDYERKLLEEYKQYGNGYEDTYAEELGECISKETIEEEEPKKTYHEKYEKRQPKHKKEDVKLDFSQLKNSEIGNKIAKAYSKNVKRK